MGIDIDPYTGELFGVLLATTQVGIRQKVHRLVAFSVTNVCVAT